MSSIVLALVGGVAGGLIGWRLAARYPLNLGPRLMPGFIRRRNPKKPARFALAGQEPRCARCWRDLTHRESWLFKYVGPDYGGLSPDTNHFCHACRYADGEETGTPSFVWERVA